MDYGIIYPIMGPNTGTPNFNQMPQPQGGAVEAGNNLPPQYNVDPATTSTSGYEQFNQAPMRAEQLPNAELLAQPVQSIPTATQAQPVATQQQPAEPVKTVDADQLEKQWVDKTQQTIAKYRDDPYEQAHQIALLVQGYLRERYGKIVGEKQQ